MSKNSGFGWCDYVFDSARDPLETAHAWNLKAEQEQKRARVAVRLEPNKWWHRASLVRATPWLDWLFVCVNPHYFLRFYQQNGVSIRRQTLGLERK